MKKGFINARNMVWIIISFFIGFTQESHTKAVNSEKKGDIIMESQVKMRNLSWSDIHKMSNDLVENLPKRKWKGILAITRGGLIPAGILSHLLGIRRIEVLNAISYQKKKSGKIQFLNMPDVQDEGEGWLIVDELSETGGTLAAVKEKFPKAYIATLIVKPKGKHAVDVFATISEQDVWLNFPWELADKD